MLRILIALLLSVPAIAADWSPRLAADYLDNRQKEWFEWAPAKAPGGPCVSCHTGATYLVARPMLRNALGESQSTIYETGLLDALRARVDKRESKDVFPSFTKEPGASQAMGVEAIHAALFLGTPQALERMWSLQGADGAWQWFSLNLDPWEMPESKFYGAALAAMAAGQSPKAARLKEFLGREQAAQPLHNRLMLLWASSRMRGAGKDTKAILEDAWRKQQPDGGWTMESLGPWKENAARPQRAGSNSYATGLAAYTLLKAGIKASDPRMKRALEWLAEHQDRESGSWASESMNKVYPPGSMMSKFMQDAATAFASMALLEGGRL